MWLKVDSGTNIINLVHCKEIYIGVVTANTYCVHLRLLDGDDRVISQPDSKQTALSIVDIIEQALISRKVYVLDLNKEITNKEIQNKNQSGVGFEETRLGHF
jgi:hypothetical protein